MTTSTPHNQSYQDLNQEPSFDEERAERARELFGHRNYYDELTQPDPFENVNTLQDMLNRDKDDRYVNKSVVVDDKTKNWRFASPDEIRKPGGKHILLLIDKKWTQGMKTDKFVMNKVPSERKYDWNLYEEYMDTCMSIQGEASQWQKALYLKSSVGAELHTNIVNNWLSKEPIEGVMHYEDLKKKIEEYFKAFEDPLMAARRFAECKQMENELISDYAVRLERARIMCNIPLGDNRMRIALITGARIERMRKEVEGPASEYNFQSLLNMGARLEAAEMRENENKKKESKEVLAVVAQPSTSQGFRGGNAQTQRGEGFQRTRGGFTGMNRRGQGFDNYNRPGQQRTWQQNQPQQFNQSGRFAQQQQNPCVYCGIYHGTAICRALTGRCNICKQIGHYERCCKTKSVPQISNQQVKPTAE